MEISELAKKINTRQDFIIFIRELINDFERNPGEWENQDLLHYLDAFAAALDNLPLSIQDFKTKDKLDWREIAAIFLTAKVYE